MKQVEVNGVELRVIDEGEGPALLLLHGFTGSAESWDHVTHELTSRFRVIRVDLLGHGASSVPPDPRRYALPLAAADLAGLLDHLAVPKACVVGYSLGGRVALHLALSAPERVAALVLESASCGIADPEERAARRAQDEALAEKILREGIEAFVAYWEKLPLFASQERLPRAVQEAQRRIRLNQRADGLAASLKGAGAGAQEWLLPQLPQLTMPVLLIVGSLDTKYCQVAQEMNAALRSSRLRVVEGAGHNVHLEKPGQYIRELQTFLAEVIERSVFDGAFSHGPLAKIRKGG